MKGVKNLMGARVSNKLFYLVLVFVVLLAANLTVLAYGTTDPDVFGHSGGELEVTTYDGVKTLQEAIDDGTLVESVEDRYSLVAPTDGSSVAVDSAYMISLCYDNDGCEIRIIATWLVSGDSEKPLPFVTREFFSLKAYDMNNHRWAATNFKSSTDAYHRYGQDGDGNREEVVVAYSYGATPACYLRDGTTGDSGLGFGFDEADSAGSNLVSCELILID
jgi:hypothetical protein